MAENKTQKTEEELKAEAEAKAKAEAEAAAKSKSSKPSKVKNGDKVVLLVVKPFAPYTPGDICGVKEEEADKMVSKGFAQYYQKGDEKKVAKLREDNREKPREKRVSGTK